MMSAPCEIDVKIQKVENRKNGTIKDKQGNTYKAPIFMVSGIKAKFIFSLQDGEDIKGQISIQLNKSKKIDHMGIRVELIGVIENLYDKNQNSTFL